VRLRVRVRKFFCDDPSCKRNILAERLGGMTRSRARRTDRQNEALMLIALTLGGRAGARLAVDLGLLAGRDALLNLVRSADDAAWERVRVLGIEQRLRVQERQYVWDRPRGPRAPQGGGHATGTLP